MSTQLSHRVWPLILGTALGALGPITWSIATIATNTQFTFDSVVSISLLFLLYLAAESRPVATAFSSTSVSIGVSTAIDIAVVLLLGPGVAITFVAVAVLITELMARRALPKLLFNVSAMVLATTAAGALFSLFGRPGTFPLADGWQVLAWVLAVMAHVAVNVTLISLVVSATSHSAFLPIWRSLSTSAQYQHWTTPPIGALIAVLGLHNPWALLLSALPLLAIYVSFRRLAELDRQTHAVIEALADALDQRDPVTAQHSRRVAAHARRIAAETRGLAHTDIETLVSAARVHDLGKIAMSDACLHKVGSLTEEEWQEMRRHPGIGASILEPLSTYRAGLDAVRHHHERWDGGGYPDGLAGEQIPFGARILAVADSYDAMTSDRPYRRALSPECAMAEIAKGSGTQFDPRVVETFQRAVRQPHGHVESAAKAPALAAVDAGPSTR